MNQLIRVNNTTCGNKLLRDESVTSLLVDEGAVVFPALRALLGVSCLFGSAGDAVWCYAVCFDAGRGGCGCFLRWGWRGALFRVLGASVAIYILTLTLTLVLILFLGTGIIRAGDWSPE